MIASSTVSASKGTWPVAAKKTFFVRVVIALVKADVDESLGRVITLAYDVSSFFACHTRTHAETMTVKQTQLVVFFHGPCFLLCVDTKSKFCLFFNRKSLYLRRGERKHEPALSSSLVCVCVASHSNAISA